MNYPFRDCMLSLLTSTDERTADCADKLESLLKIYPREHVHAMYVPLGSHDTERILTKVDKDVDKVKLAFLFQFAFPGAPAIYYGDEIGMLGGKDPDCRGAFPWDQKHWNTELREWVKLLITLRNRHKSLRRGDFIHILSDSRRCCYSFARSLGDESIVIAINASASNRKLHLPIRKVGWEDGQIIQGLLDRGDYSVSGGEIALNLPAWSGVWLADRHIGLL
jgi:glycosidase